MDLPWHVLTSLLQVKTVYHSEKQGFSYSGFQKKNSRHTHQNWLKSIEPSFRKVSLPPANNVCFFSAHLWVREFWPQIYSLWQAPDWGLLSKILASTKNGWGLEYRMVNFLEYLGQGTLGCYSLSSLLFRHFSSPTNIHTHCS